MAGYRSPSARRAAADASGKPNPTLKPLGLEGTAKVGVASTIGIVQATPGSTITVQSGSLPAGMTLNSAARTITGTPQVAGSSTFTLRETLAGATNTPRDTTQAAMVMGAATPAEAEATKIVAALNERGFFVLGDSRSVLFRDPTKKNRSAEFWINHANALMGGRMQILGANAASGDRTDQYLSDARIAEAVTSGAKYIFFGMGPLNDIAQAGTIGTVDHFSGPGNNGFPGVKARLDYLIGIGRVPVISTDPGATNITTVAQLTALNLWNRKVRQYAAVMTGKVIFIDIAAIEQDHANTTASLIAFPANMKYDQTHNTNRMGAIVGARLAEILSPLIPAFPIPFANDSDVAANGGQALVNPAFRTQTGGTVSVGSVTNGGAAPSGWIISDDSASVAVTVDVTADEITRAAHGYPNGTPMTFTGGTLPGGVSAGTIYYLRDVTANTFKVAATLGGAALDLTGTPANVTARLRNASAAISYEPDDNGTAMVAAITWYKPGYFVVSQDIAAGEAPGETWEAMGRIRLSAGHANCAGGMLQLESNRGAVTYPAADLFIDGANSIKALTDGAYDWTLTPPPLTINPGARGWFSLLFKAYGVAAGATATLKFSRPRVVKRLTL